MPLSVRVHHGLRLALATLLTTLLVIAVLSASPSAAAVAPTIAPAVVYDFEGNALDSSGNGNHGTWRTTTTYPEAYVDGVDGQAMRFQRGQSFVSLPPGIQPSTDGFAVEFWYRQEAQSRDGAVFGNLDFRAATNPGFLIAMNDNTANARISMAGVKHQREILTDATTAGWVHLAVVVDARARTLTTFRDGVQVATGAYTGTKALATSLPFRIGADGNAVATGQYPTSWVTGAVDDFRFYTQPISADQIRAGVLGYPVAVTGGENGTAAASHQEARVGTVVTLTADPATGYRFDSWEASAPADLEIADGSFVMPAEAVEIRAVFLGVEYEVAYDANGGAGTTSASTHVYGTASALTANGFERPGYGFAGWSTSADGPVVHLDGARVSDLSTEHGATVTLYAQWVPAGAHAVVVTAGPHGSVSADRAFAMPGERVTLTATPDLGHRLVAWRGADGLEVVDGVFVMPAEDVVLTAEFAPIEYTVVYEPNGGTGTVAPREHRYGVPAALAPGGFRHTDFTFTGWNTAADGSGTAYAAGAQVENLTTTHGATVRVYAQWEPARVSFGGNADVHNNWSTLTATLDYWNELGLDGGVLVGDLTENATASEIAGLKRTLQGARGDLDLVVTRGNHDHYSSVASGVWRDATGSDGYIEDTVINGYHFLTATCNSSTVYPTSVKDFLEERLAALTAEDPDRPVFVLAHCPLPRSVYAAYPGSWSSSGLGRGDTTSIFDPYPQAVVISGHIHYPNRVPTAIWQQPAGWTAVNVPAFKLYWIDAPETGDGRMPYVDPQTTIFDVEGSVVSIRQVDLTTGEPDGMVWSWDVADRGDRPYTDARADRARPPVWQADSAVVATEVTSTSAKLAFPQAVPGSPADLQDIVHHYISEVRDAETGQRIGATVRQTSGWVRHTLPESLTWSASGLAECGEYEAVVRAYGTAFSARTEWRSNPASAPLTSRFATAGDCAVTVTSEGDGAASTSSATALSGTTVTLTATPEAGHHLAEWRTEPAVAVAGDGTFVMPAGPVTVTAVFAPNSYTIAYDGNGADTGSTDATTHRYGEPAALATNGFARAGHRFVGWATSATGDVVHGDAATVVDLTAEHGATVTLYAVWSAVAVPVMVETGGSGSGSASASRAAAEPGERIALTATAAPGSRFVGWEVVAPATLEIVDDAFSMPAQAVTVRAVFDLVFVNPEPSTGPTPPATSPTPPSGPGGFGPEAVALSTASARVETVDGRRVLTVDVPGHEDEWFFVTVYSSAVELGWYRVVGGALTASLPPSVPGGAHTVALLTASGAVPAYVPGVRVPPPPGSGPAPAGDALADSGRTVDGGALAALLLALGAVAVVLARRRSRRLA